MSLNFFDAQTTCIGLLGLIATQDSLRALVGLVSCVIWMFDMAIPFRGVRYSRVSTGPCCGPARQASPRPNGSRTDWSEKRISQEKNHAYDRPCGNHAAEIAGLGLSSIWDFRSSLPRCAGGSPKVERHW